MSSIQEAARQINEVFKTERERNLEAKISMLEEIIANLAERIDMLEKNCYN